MLESGAGRSPGVEARLPLRREWVPEGAHRSPRSGLQLAVSGINGASLAVQGLLLLHLAAGLAGQGSTAAQALAGLVAPLLQPFQGGDWSLYAAGATVNVGAAVAVVIYAALTHSLLRLLVLAHRRLLRRDATFSAPRPVLHRLPAFSSYLEHARSGAANLPAIQPPRLPSWR